MEKNQKIILVAGGLITLGLLVIDVFALIALVFVLVLLMTFHIMGRPGTTRSSPRNSQRMPGRSSSPTRAQQRRGISMLPLSHSTSSSISYRLNRTRHPGSA